MYNIININFNKLLNIICSKCSLLKAISAFYPDKILILISHDKEQLDKEIYLHINIICRCYHYIFVIMTIIQIEVFILFTIN